MIAWLLGASALAGFGLGGGVSTLSLPISPSWEGVALEGAVPAAVFDLHISDDRLRFGMHMTLAAWDDSPLDYLSMGLRVGQQRSMGPATGS